VESLKCRIVVLAAVAGGVSALLSAVGLSAAPAAEPLELVAKIPLGDVRDRIDHMAIDLARQRLFVAELGNNSIGIVDLKAVRTIHTIAGLREPQGVGYAASTDTLWVASAGDGSVRFYRGDDYATAGRVELGEDADNIRIDEAANRAFVGYGNGAVAVLDLTTRARIADIGLKSHPESFQLDAGGKRIFVNVPNAREVAVIDGVAGRQTGSWTTSAHGNFPMALDAARKRVVVVFRSPPRLVAYAMQDGGTGRSVDTCGDADDVLVDARRRRVYVSCGEGYLDAFDEDGDAYRRIARIATAPGARTALFVPELDRLFIAVRATPAEHAAIWIYRPQP
jgi:hypothetical protein